jgi:dTDP-4-dehydrorhamnose reductase
MKILLFGAGGLLGRNLVRAWAGQELTPLSHAEADITDRKKLDDLFAQPWNVVVNAAAVCNFDACERDPIGTGLINREAPLDLARRCHETGAKFVQFTSDYVFRGDADRPRTETDPVEPISVYGQQKADLEREIPGLCPQSLILRLSWLFGENGKTFMSLLPGLLAREATLRVAAGKRGRCLYARDAAGWIRRLVEGGHTGVFNLVNEGDTSWEEFARVCLDRMRERGPEPACREIIEIPYQEMGPNWSKRPRFSCLDTGKLAQTLPPGPRGWTEALDDFLDDQKTVAPKL